MKDVYLDSQVTIGVLSNYHLGGGPRSGRRPGRRGTSKESEAGEILTAAQTAAVRTGSTTISGSTRMLAHGLLYVGQAATWLTRSTATTTLSRSKSSSPTRGRATTSSNSAKVDSDPNSLMTAWRHDDEQVAYPMYEVITEDLRPALKGKKPGFNNICVHKGLSTPGPAGPRRRGHPGDIPKAARDWPQLNFITYHACIRPGFFLANALRDVKSGKLRQACRTSCGRRE